MQKNWWVINLNKNYFLRVANKVFRCQVGSLGLKNAAKKIEGDKTTPIGKWYLETLYYRSDRVLRPRLKKNVLKINQITKYCGWCNDIKSHYYNKYIKINNFRSLNTNYERLWRDDNVYDIILEISHNTKPIIKNKGSAIFIHVAKRNYKKTEGCVALKKIHLIKIVKELRKNTRVKIENRK